MTIYLRKIFYRLQKFIIPANILIFVILSWVIISVNTNASISSIQTQTKIQTSNISYQIISQNSTKFGKRSYAIYNGRIYEIKLLKTAQNTPKIGLDYSAEAEISNYTRADLLDSENEALNPATKEEQRHNYALSTGVWGEIKVITIKKVSKCNFSCALIQNIDFIRTNASLTILRSSCNLFGHDWQYLSPISNCGDIAALLQGLLLGGSGGFSPEMQQNFRNTGITHIVAISGFNITLIIVTLQYVLERLKLSFKLQFALIMLILAIFIALVGPSPSVLRAGFMSAIMLLARVFGRTCSAVRALLLASIIMLLYNPYFLFSVSFQLSFLATFGLLSFFETLPELDFQWFRSLLETGWATIVANLYTLPVLINTFGYFSPLSVLPNVIILPFIPLIMLLDLLVFVPFIGSYLGVIPGLFCAWILGLVEWFSSWLPLLYLEKLSWLEVGIWYIFLFSLGIFIRWRRGLKLESLALLLDSKTLKK